MSFFNPSETVRTRVAARFPVVSWIGLPLILLGLQAQAVQAQFRDLVSRLPSGANAVVLLNVEKALASPFGVQEGWKENVQKAFDAGLTRVPPEATQFVLAAQMDLEYMEPVWEAGLVNVSKPISLETLAKRRSGTLDKVGNYPAVALPNDTYVIEFDANTFGAMGPANRQAVLRWLRELMNRSDSALPPYLRRAAGFSDDAGTEAIMAIDLEGVLNEEFVYSRLESHEVLEASNVDRRKLAKLLSGVLGVRIGIRLGEKPFGKIVVDFTDDVSMMAPFAKPLLLNVLSNVGAKFDNLEGWKGNAQGTEVSLEGYLTSDGLRRLMSVIESPAPAEAGSEKAEETATPAASDKTAAKATLEQFQSVTAMFDDLKKDWRDLKTLSSASLYFDKYAKKIERLPVLNVDKDFLDYRGYVAGQMRAASGAVRTMGIRGSVRQSQITSADTAPYTYGGYRYGRYGWYGGWGGAGNYAVYDPRMEARNIGSERRKVRYQERGAMATSVQKIRDQVITATNDIRVKMSERYQVEF